MIRKLEINIGYLLQSPPASRPEISGRPQAYQAQRSWSDLRSSLEIAKTLQGSAQARLDLLSKQERSLSKIAHPGTSNPFSSQLDVSNELHRITLLARENRVYLQKNIKTETDLVNAYAERVGILNQILEKEKLRWKAANFFLAQKGLPVEIWRRIFLLAIIHDKGRHSLTLSQVCRFWRDVAIGYSELWARIPVESKSTKIAILEFERFLSRITPNRCLYIHFRPSGLHFRFSAYDIEVSTQLTRTIPHSVNGQDTAYTMHDISGIHSLELEGGGNGNISSPNVTITSWRINHLHCRELLPWLSPNVGEGITKLTLNFRKWPDSTRIEQCFRLTTSLEELNLNCRTNVGWKCALSAHSPLLPRLRILRTTFEILTFNLVVLAQSPYLRRIGIYPTEASPPVVQGLHRIVNERIPRLIQSINHLEFHTIADSTFQYQLSCSFLIALFRSIHTLELRGSHSASLLRLCKKHLSDEAQRSPGEWQAQIDEIVLKDCALGSTDLVGWMKPIQVGNHLHGIKDVSMPRLTRISLERCVGLNLSECDMLGRMVDVLDITC